MAGRLRSAIVTNAGLKLIAVLLAVLLWVVATVQESTEMGYVVPVDLTNIPDNLAIEGSALEFVHLRLRGSRNLLQTLSPQQIRASIDLSRLKAGDNYIPVGPSDIKIPPGVEIVGISPPYLSARVAARRLVPIRPVLRGRPAEGYVVARVEAIPAKVYVVGPQGKVAVIREVATVPVAIRNARASSTNRADLLLPDPGVRLMELKPTEVVVTIAGHPEERLIPDVPVTVRGESAAVVSPPRVSVRVRGPFDVIANLAAGDLEAVVDPPAGKRSTRPVEATAPEGITVLGVSPANVAVTTP